MPLRMGKEWLGVDIAVSETYPASSLHCHNVMHAACKEEDQYREIATQGHRNLSMRESASDRSHCSIYDPGTEHKILKRLLKIPRSSRTVHTEIVVALEVDSRQGAVINGVVGPS